MKKITTDFNDVFIIEPDVFGDNRGWFMESYSTAKFHDLGIETVFVQDNHSFTSDKGTLRGLHFQKNDMAQTKLVRCTKGKIKDIAVDLRENSPMYLKWQAFELSSENKCFLYIPKGFAHGFLTLTDNVEIEYKVDALYSKEHDMSIAWNDNDIGVDWGIENPILSFKDKNAEPLGGRVFFTYGE